MNENLIRELFGSLIDEDPKLINIHRSFKDLGIDSFDLLDLRSTIESSYQTIFSDEEWIKLTKPSDLLGGKWAVTERSLVSGDNASLSDKKSFKLNMPHMANGGLSDHWLLKELGDMHWRMISKGLSAESDQIVDERGDRLYATFVRISFTLKKNLRSFFENETFDISGEIKRFGKNLFLTKLNSLKIEGQLLSSFVSRSGDNSTLTKGEVLIPSGCTISEVKRAFPFSESYKKLRKEELESIYLLDLDFSIRHNKVFETTYEINPYVDLNGVDLLYFAAYPVINSYCERKFFNKLFEDDWAKLYSLIHLDIYYYSNANINDKIIYILNSYETYNDRYYIYSSLFREKDGKKMADIFSVKTRSN